LIYLTVVCGLLIILAGALVAALLLERKATAELLAHFEVMHQQERARIMSAPPRMVQQPSQPRQRTPDQAERERARAREMASVGTVQHIRPE
jgi:hypothetical protein